MKYIDATQNESGEWILDTPDTPDAPGHAARIYELEQCLHAYAAELLDTQYARKAALDLAKEYDAIAALYAQQVDHSTPAGKALLARTHTARAHLAEISK